MAQLAQGQFPAQQQVTETQTAGEYQLANVDSQPSFYNNPMEKTLINHHKGSIVGQYDS